MDSNLTQIEFYFPHEIEKIKNKENLADLIVESIRERKSILHAGFSDESLLHNNILTHIGDASISNYISLSEAHKKEIKDCIEKIVVKCNTYLSIPTKNYIFVLPYLPMEKDSVFGGVMGFSPYSCVFYVFLSPKLWSLKSLADTVAHELNHTIFYYYHYDTLNNYTLLDGMVLEGLAENFRECVLSDDTPAPWASALTQEKAFTTLDKMDKKILFSKDKHLINNVLFGNDSYEHWTGYSIGYWLIKKLLHKTPELSWEEVMKLSSVEILRIIKQEKRAQQP